MNSRSANKNLIKISHAAFIQIFFLVGLTSSQRITCPTDGSYAGQPRYVGKGPSAAPLRGTIGCVENPVSDSNLLIYGPFEAGFTNAQLSNRFGCTSSSAFIPAGLDTLTAEKVAAYECNIDESSISILDSCGGHANPYHYHEKMTCLYTADPVTQHSTRVGTALDGNGIYGKYIDGGVQPTDLDACGGRYGITPDSNGEIVYYYVIQDVAPFTVGCFGPVNSVSECRALYSTCDDGDEMTITTASGTIQYDPDCPCFDKDNSMSNVVSEMASTTTIDTTSTTTTSTTTTSTTTTTTSEMVTESSSGFCSYNSCKSEGGSEWCRVSQDRCENNCNGVWCPSNDGSISELVSTTSTTTEDFSTTSTTVVTTATPTTTTTKLATTTTEDFSTTSTTVVTTATPTTTTTKLATVATEPSSGFCSYNNCNSEGGSAWCRVSKDRCEDNCNGLWCPSTSIRQRRKLRGSTSIY